jgi:hypothetical protein
MRHEFPAIALAVVCLRRRGPRRTGRIAVTLVEADGTAWRGATSLEETWTTTGLPLTRRQPASATKLRLGYPGNWNHELPPAEGRGGVSDQLQLTALAAGNSSLVDATVDISRIELVFE